MKYTKDDIRKMLRRVREKYYIPLPYREIYNDLFWQNEAMWLGDTSFLTVLPYKGALQNKTLYVKSSSVFLEPLMKYNKHYVKSLSNEHHTSIHDINGYDFGGGHFLQILERALGLEVDIKPKTYFDIKCDKVKNSVLINIEGHHYNHLTSQVIYILQKFVDRNKDKYTFVETYAKQEDPYLKDIYYIYTDVFNLIKEMSKFEYFIGFDSGLMHIASGLNIKSVIVIDDILGLKTDMLYLPREFDSDLMPGTDYLYPQNVHLYMNDENELVKQFTLDNLERAIGGDLYPYWSDDYLDIIF